MATVTWFIEGDSIHNYKQKSMGAPREVGEIAEWFRAARLSIPSIPNPLEAGTRWHISNFVATADVIVFEMHSNLAERGIITIDRRTNAMGYPDGTRT